MLGPEPAVAKAFQPASESMSRGMQTSRVNSPRAIYCMFHRLYTRLANRGSDAFPNVSFSLCNTSFLRCPAARKSFRNNENATPRLRFQPSARADLAVFTVLQSKI